MEGADRKYKDEVRGLLGGKEMEFGVWLERTEAFWAGNTNRMKQSGLIG